MAFIFLLVWIFLPSVVLAQQLPPVLINEIAWMGSFVDEVDINQHWRYEWLELHNTGDIPFTLDGWNVELYRQDELYFMIPLLGNLPLNGYFLIGASDKIPHSDVSYANLGGKLVNSGMRVVLKDVAGNIVDEVDARDGWQAGVNESKRTMERATDGWQTSAKVGGTPKSKNSEGFEELVLNLSSFATKKDPKGSSENSLHIFNGTILLAVLLALGSSVGILGLRRLLVRPEQS